MWLRKDGEGNKNRPAKGGEKGGKSPEGPSEGSSLRLHQIEKKGPTSRGGKKKCNEGGKKKGKRV